MLRSFIGSIANYIILLKTIPELDDKLKFLAMYIASYSYISYVCLFKPCSLKTS